MNIKDKEKLTKHIERNQVMTEITMFGKTADVEAVPSDRLLDYIEELTSPVKVPAFVAEWIEEVRQRGCGLADALNCFASPIIPNEVEEWVEFNSSALGMHHDHQELLARAWLDGYEVEPPKWIVKKKNGDYVEGYANATTSFTIYIDSHLDSTTPHKFTKLAKAEAVAYLVEGAVEKV